MTGPSLAASGRRPARPFPLIKVVGGVLTAAAVGWSFAKIDARWDRLTAGPGAFWRLLKLMAADMTWSDLSRCARAMWESVAMAWLGTILAAVIAIPLSFLAAENLVPRWFSLVVRQVFNVLRAIPDVVLVIALIPLFGFSKTAGVVAIAIGSVGTLAKLCSEIVESIDPGPVEAGAAVGATRLQRLRWTVVPQVVPEISSFVLYRFEINIRVSAILGVIGVGGIGGILNDNFTYKNWGIAGMALITVIVATIAIDTASGWVRRRILTGPRRDAAELWAAEEPAVVAELMT